MDISLYFIIKYPLLKFPNNSKSFFKTCLFLGMKREKGKKGKSDKEESKETERKQKKKNPPLTTIIMKGVFTNLLKLILHPN